MIDCSLKWWWYPPPFTDTDVKTITIFSGATPARVARRWIPKAIRSLSCQSFQSALFTLSTQYILVFFNWPASFRLWYRLQETINILEKRHSAWLIQRSKAFSLEGGGMFKLPSYISFQWRQNRFVVIYFRGLNNLGQQLREWITITGMN